MKYYVYALIDPRTNQPFYIGKGKGNRCTSHLKETYETTINHKKFNKIQSIRSCGVEPRIEILAYFIDENLAYEFEILMISTTQNLTNIQPGGKGGQGNMNWKRDNPSSKTKGQSYEQRYGEEKAKQMKQVRSEKLTGRQFSEQTRAQMSSSAQQRDHTYKCKIVNTPDGKFNSLHEAAVHYGISDSAMSQRLSSPKHPDFYREV